MSRSELERFSDDLRSDRSLYDRVASAGTEVTGLVEVANANGYAFTVDDVNACAAESQEVSEEALDGVTGGSRPFPIVFGVITRIVAPVVF